MPDDQRTRVRHEVRFVRRQYRAQVTEVVELAEVAKRWLNALLERERKRRMAAIKAKEHEVVPVAGKTRELLAPEHHRVRRIAADEALVVPDRYEAGAGFVDRGVQPVRVLAPLSMAVDEGTREDVLILPCARQFTGFRARITDAPGLARRPSADPARQALEKARIPGRLRWWLSISQAGQVLRSSA